MVYSAGLADGPLPERRIIGDLADFAAVLKALGAATQAGES